MQFWSSTKREPFPQLNTEDTEFDTVVIGGGIFGLSTALELKEKGQKVALIEALEIGNGATSQSAGQLTSLHPFFYGKIQRKIGDKQAKTYYEMNQYGINKAEEICQKYDIDCNFRRTDSYLYTYENKKSEKLLKEFSTIKKCVESGKETKLLNQEASKNIGLPPTVSSGIISAVVMPDQALFNPYEFVTQLAEIIHSPDTPIYENSRVISISKTSPYKIKTNEGSVIANNIVLATHLPILDYSNGYSSVTKPCASYTMVLKLQDDENLPNGMYFNVDKPYRYISTVKDKDGNPYLLVHGQNHGVTEKDNKEQMALLETWAKSSFSVKEIISKWYSFDYLSADIIPYIGSATKDKKKVYIATGFNGWGLALSIAAGSLISDLIMENNEKEPWVSTFDASRWDLKNTIFQFASNQIRNAKHFVGDTMMDMMNSRKISDIENLPLDSSCISYKGRQPVAVYKDKDGVVHSISAVCTHQGCHVRFNNQEKTWDCPCHGSRYDIDGSVLHGPTCKSLKKIDISKEAKNE